jgi:hypothetical protein
VHAEVYSEYDWAITKILLEGTGISIGAEGIEHVLPKSLKPLPPVIDVIAWGVHIHDILELDRKAHEELEKRLNCKDSSSF